MTPAPPTGLTPGNENLTVKQQRQVQRAKKLEDFHRKQKRSVRNRRIGLTSGIVAGAAVIGLLITSVVLTPQTAKYSAGGDGTTIKGVQTFSNAAGHVQAPVMYAQTPPAGGEHNPAWLNCGIYTEPVANENAVHSLEHSAVWVTYDPSLSASDLETLKSKLPSTYVILSPYDGLSAPIVISGWNAQIQVDSADDERISTFFEEYWKSNTAPEPGAACTGGVDETGQIS